jgi:hypothetical protein
VTLGARFAGIRGIEAGGLPGSFGQHAAAIQASPAPIEEVTGSTEPIGQFVVNAPPKPFGLPLWSPLNSTGPTAKLGFGTLMSPRDYGCSRIIDVEF